MSPEEAVIARLETISAVTAIVGTRIYQLLFPQGVTWPAVRVQLISEPTDDRADGEPGILMARVQVDAVARVASGVDPYAAAVTLARAIHGNGRVSAPTGLQRWRGSIGSPPYVVKGITRIDRDTRYDPEELRLVWCRQDYRVWVSEAAV